MHSFLKRSLPTTVVAMLTAFAVGHSHAVPLDVYGHLPTIEDAAISPDGSRLAFVRTTGDARAVVVASIDDRKLLGMLKAGDNKVRAIAWADDSHLMITTSAATVPDGLRGMKSEWFGLQLYDVARKTFTVLPDARRIQREHVMNALSGLPMVRRTDGELSLFLQGIHVADRTRPALIRADIDTGFETLVVTGSHDIDRWLVDGAGVLVAGQGYDEEQQRWAISLRRDGRLREVLSGTDPFGAPSIEGFSPDGNSLLVQFMDGGESAWRSLAIKDGTLGPPPLELSIGTSPLEDPATHRMIGACAEDDGRCRFVDHDLQVRWDAVAREYAGSVVRVVSISNGFDKAIITIDGQTGGYRYCLADLRSGDVRPIGDVYDGIARPLEVRAVEYPAADGLRIEAFLTLPPGGAPKALPLIVLPHGGPAVRDGIDFDWWSQALADQGYAVLRPNYRGSATTQANLRAGYGEWGRKMQSDLSDGVRFLARAGLIDPARVCIVGASYGGYAALAGVTLQTGVYRCAVSVAGISDPGRMLSWVNSRNLSSDSSAQRYWDRFMGATGPDDPVLVQISPMAHVDAVHVPVLLVHGKDDTVVPYEQSQLMLEAMQRAGKDVRLVKLDDEDHWLSRGATRLRMLQATVSFLRTNNPPDTTSPSEHASDAQN
jgi:dipeptidyl aminopeptidase/acylaminoacyl peptidase